MPMTAIGDIDRGPAVVMGRSAHSRLRPRTVPGMPGLASTLLDRQGRA